MVFQGTPTRTAFDIAREAEECGAETNAFTSYEETVFYVSGPKSKAELFLDIYSDSLHNSVFAEEEFEKERKVILEEWRTRHEHNTRAVTNLLFETMLGLQGSIIGDEETVSRITPDNLRTLAYKYYKPANIVISMAGGISHSKAQRLAEKFFGNFHKAWSGKSELKGPSARGVADRYAERVREHITQSAVAIGFWAPPITDDRSYALDILMCILGCGSSSRLFQEVRDKRGLAYSIRAGYWGFSNAGISSVVGYTSEPKEAHAVIMQEIEKICSEYVSDAELEKAKTMNTADLETCEKTYSFGARNLNALMWHGRIVPIQEEIAQYREVTKEAVRAAAEEVLRFDGMITAVTAPRSMRGQLIQKQ